MAPIISIIGGVDFSDIATQDNCGTVHPIFMVQRRVRTYGFDPTYTSDGGVWLDDEYNEISAFGDWQCPGCDAPLTHEAFESEECEVCFESLNLSDFAVTHTAYRDEWVNVQPFFTRSGAEKYLLIDGHNLRGPLPPRIYVEGAHRNAEWQAIRAFLLNGAVSR